MGNRRKRKGEGMDFSAMFDSDKSDSEKIQSFGIILEDISSSMKQVIESVEMSNGQVRREMADFREEVNLRFDTVDQVLRRHSAEITELKTDVAELKIDVTELKTDVAELKTDVAELKTDVAELKTDVAELKTDVAELKTDVAELKTDVAELKTDVAELKTDVAELKTDVAGLKTDVAELKIDVAELKTEMSAVESRLTQKIDKIAIVTDDHEVRITTLERGVA